jgi:hypothetical protein
LLLKELKKIEAKQTRLIPEIRKIQVKKNLAQDSVVRTSPGPAKASLEETRTGEAQESVV